MSGSGEQQRGDIRYDSDFRRIEELIKGNTFSREEINHLLEILNSRAACEGEKQIHNGAATGTALVLGRHEILARSSVDKQHSADRVALSTPHINRDKVPAGVSASPIDIARAYMAGRVSEGGQDFHGFASNAENHVQEFARRELLPPPSPKPSICWPGAMVPDRRLGYATPLSQTGRNRLHDFPRTPYSRSILPKTTSRLRADSAYASPSTPFQQPQTPVSGQARSTAETVDVFGSVGPIRRIRNKFASEVRPRGSIFLSSPKNVHSNTVKPKSSGVLLPSSVKNFETGETSGSSKYLSGHVASDSSDRNNPNSNLSSNEAVRKILEHLDRTKPTPKDKEAELGFATPWKRTPRPLESDAMLEQNFSKPHSDKITTAGHNFGMDKSSSKSNYLMDRSKGISEAKDAVDGNSETSSAIFSGPSSILGVNALPPFGPKWASDSASKNLQENASMAGSVNGMTPSIFNSFKSNQSNKENSNIFPKNSHGNKPSLPSISIHKPEFRAANNGLGFSFPVFTSSPGVSAEPPTPSIAPSSSSLPPMAASQPSPEQSVAYSFGENRSTPRLVFSFPSVSNSATEDDPDIKFSFGSEKNHRLAFGSLKKDGICF